MNFLADAAVTDHLISGEWLIAVIGALASGAALLLGKRQGIKEATNNVTLQSPVPTVPFQKVQGNVTWDHFQPLVTRMDRLESHLDKVRKEQSDQYREILDAGAQREQRMTTHFDTTVLNMTNRIDSLLKPRTGR